MYPFFLSGPSNSLCAGCVLQAGRSVEVPVYDFTRHARSEEVRKVCSSSGTALQLV